MEFSPFMIFIMVLSFFAITFFVGMLIHSAFIYEDKRNLKSDSKKAWVLSMSAGFGLTVWMFIYGYYANFIWNTGQ